MAYSTNNTYYVTNQPVVGNPFEQLNGEWGVGLCDCCDDVSQCELIDKLFEYLHIYDFSRLLCILVLVLFSWFISRQD